MKTFGSAVVLSAALLLWPGTSLADDTPQGVEPTEPAPTWTPPPPTEVNFAGGEEVVVQQAVPAGQWVFTSQYGWIWMPHGNSFTFLPTNGSAPNMFVYYPAVGWSWVIAPWVWGWGAMPWFGFAGWGGYPWYGSGFGTWYGFARPYAYAGWHGGGYYQGGRWNGVGPGYRPLPGRGGYAPPRPGVGGPPSAGRPGGPGAVPGRYGAAPGRMGTSPRAAPAAVPGRTGAVPARTYGGSAGRPTGALPSSFGAGRGTAIPSRAFTSGGSGMGPRAPAVAAMRGGGFGGGGRPAVHGGGGYSGGGARPGGFGGGGGGGGGHGGGGRR